MSLTIEPNRIYAKKTHIFGHFITCNGIPIDHKYRKHQHGFTKPWVTCSVLVFDAEGDHLTITSRFAKYALLINF